MFRLLQIEVLDRFSAVEAYFKTSRRLAGDLSATARGLAFVQVYGVYEYSVVNSMQAAIDAITAHNHSFRELRPAILSLFLDAQFSSARNCGTKKVWEGRLKLLDTAFSDDPATTGNGILPVDGSHFRHQQLELIFRVLGINRMPVRRRRHLHRIDEVVNNRNFIAHGETTPADIGRRYTRRDIFTTIRQMRSVCVFIPEVVGRHCLDRDNFRRI